MAQNGTELILKGKKLKIAEMLADPDCKLSQTQIMNDVGVPHTTFYRWMRDPKFIAAVNNLVEQYTNTKLPYVWQCLLMRMPVDPAAIKLYFELKGRYQQKVVATVEHSNPYAALTEEELRRLANGEDPKGGPDTG